MKKIVIGFLILFLCSIILMSIAENPFSSFMGMRWGVSAKEMYETFEYELQTPYLKKFPMFVLNNFKLGSLIIKKIVFSFKSNEKELSFKEKNYSKFFFSSVLMSTTPDQFESLLDIFTMKYGIPNKRKDSKIQNRMGAEFLQTYAYWENGDRSIYLYRYGNKIDEGLVSFNSKSEMKKNAEKDERQNEKAADIL